MHSVYQVIMLRLTWLRRHIRMEHGAQFGFGISNFKFRLCT